MPTETNVFSRNLKVISILFIVYWFVGAHPKDNEIVLGTLKVAVDNPERLKYVGWTLLGYFAWRFYIHSKKKIRTSYSKFLRNTILFNELKFWNKKLTESANNDFLNNGGFEKFKSANRGVYFDSLLPSKCYLTLPSLINSSAPSTLTYQYSINLPRETPNRPAVVNPVTVHFKFNLIWKTLLHLHVFIRWARSNEDSADFLLPWILFTLAVLSILHSNYFDTSTLMVSQ